MLKYDFTNCFNERHPVFNTSAQLSNRYAAMEEALKKVKSAEPGFLKILDRPETLSELLDFKPNLSAYDNFVVLGIGGSALGNTALHRSLKPFHWEFLSREERKGQCRVFVWDNVDPDFLQDQMSLVGLNQPGVDASKTLFNVISKSGNTAESMAMYLYVRNALEKQSLDPKKHIVFTTDPEKGILRQISRKEGFMAFTIPPEVGGRFSVLTPVGLLSALAAGIDIEKLFKGAQETKKRLLSIPVSQNPAALIALHHLLYYEKGLSLSVMMAYSNALYTWADWYRQLWAESLGKKVNRSGQEVFIGPTPIKALGVTDQHSQVQLYNEGKLDKVLTFLEVETFRNRLEIPSMYPELEGLSYLGNQRFNDLINLELRGTEYALKKHGRPSLRVVFPRIDEAHVGEFILTYELATTLFATMIDIDPFDQPGVELGKRATYALMGREGYDDLAKEIRSDKGEDA